ncbi:MAG: CDP-glycerol glycerophosphotransferase family protein [Defluviitaleaceae bacterium]|nr:CDP-glycerol glycerophosphotransferase family protein [Defluviitaleaceae bacterium]
MSEKIKISVIVPGYNVDPYLEECLDSIANQTLSGLQVILVDDGSPGRTPEMMDAYADKYEHFEVIHQENQGISMARNTGVRYAKGTYIAFVDSDDVLPHDAYEKMYGQISKTKSDIVVGSVTRFNSSHRGKSPLHKKAIHDTIERTHITKNPELLYDTTVWNKLFRRSLWEECNMLFPTGMIYEDIPVTLKMHYYANSVDILDETVYYWRIREGNDKSFTQSRTEYRYFEDRVKSQKMVDEFFEAHDFDEHMYIAKDFKRLSLDYLLFIDELIHCDETYREKFQSEIKKEIKKIHPKAFEKLALIDQMKYQFILNDQLALLFQLDSKVLNQTKPYLKDGRYVVDYPNRDIFSKDFFDVTDHLTIQSRIGAVEIVDSQVKILGHAYIHKMDARRASDVSLNAELVNVLTGAKLSVQTVVKKNKEVTRRWGMRKPHALLPTARIFNYHFSGFEITFDLQKALTLLGDGTWKIKLDLTVQGLQKTSYLANPMKNSKKGLGQILKGYEVIPGYNNIWELVFRVGAIQHFIQEIKQEQDDVMMKGWTKEKFVEGALSLALTSGKERTLYPLIPINDAGVSSIDEIGDVYAFQVTIPALDYFRLNGSTRWELTCFASGLKTKCLTLPDFHRHAFVFGDKELILKVNNSCQLTFSFYPYVHPRIESIAWKQADVLSLKIIQDEQAGHVKHQTLVLVSRESGDERKIDLRPIAQGQHTTYETEISFLNEMKEMSFALGVWDFYLESCDSENKSTRKPLLFDKEVVNQISYRINGNIRTMPYQNLNHGLSMRNTLWWNRFENSTRKKKIIQKVFYPLMRLLPLKKNTIIFESYWGRSYSCNPRAIYEYIQKHQPSYQCIWFLDNENIPINGSGKKVRKESWRYWYYLARGHYFVENANFPDRYVKRPKQIEVQTLHGTFLKKMGLDDFGTFDTEEKKAGLLQRASRWDYLISPSAYMTTISKRVFCYNKDMLETGFPRNDVLYQNNHPKSIEALKAQLNLPKDKKILLYAPTYRARSGFDVTLDLDQLANELSEEYVVLMRLHYFVAKSLDISKYGTFIRNMSSYPDIQELYLVSDVLMTDYSSVMFDYVHLKRPMIFFAYDLALYRDILRGMYLDYEKEIPGPIAKTTEEVVALLLALDEVQTTYQEKIESFYDVYGMYGRGDSAEQVYKRVFDQRQD